MKKRNILKTWAGNKARVLVKWGLPFCLLTLLPLSASAQIKFGYFSYERAFKAMPEYTIVQKQMGDLKAQYEAEAKRVEEEFNNKYERFLEVQHELAPTIRNKRQTELQELMAKNIQFKEDARRQYAEAEQQALQPLKDKLSEVLKAIGTERGYAFILNTDSNACPFIDPLMGEDVSLVVENELKK